MVSGFPLFFAQVATIRCISSLSFRLVDSHNFVPRHFPSKKTHPHWNPRPPNNILRKRIFKSLGVGAIKGSNWKFAILSLQLKISFISLLTIKGCSFWNKDSTSPISQSLKCLQKRGLQPPKSLPSSQTPDTQPSLLIGNRNKLGKASFKVWSSHHKSFQDLTLLPFPTIKWDLHLMPSHSFFIVDVWKNIYNMVEFEARKCLLLVG